MRPHVESKSMTRFGHHGSIHLGRKPWNSDLHPRDNKGRFIETGGTVRLWGSKTLGKVVRALGRGQVLVQLPGGREEKVDHHRLTMVARPDGSAPTKSVQKVRDEDMARAAHPGRGDGIDAHDHGPNGDKHFLGEHQLPHDDGSDDEDPMGAELRAHEDQQGQVHNEPADGVTPAMDGADHAFDMMIEQGPDDLVHGTIATLSQHLSTLPDGDASKAPIVRRLRVAKTEARKRGMDVPDLGHDDVPARNYEESLRQSIHKDDVKDLHGDLQAAAMAVRNVQRRDDSPEARRVAATKLREAADRIEGRAAHEPRHAQHAEKLRNLAQEMDAPQSAEARTKDAELRRTEAEARKAEAEAKIAEHQAESVSKTEQTAPETHPTEETREPVRQESSDVLADVPAEPVRDDQRPDGVLHQDGSADRAASGGPGVEPGDGGRSDDGHDGVAGPAERGTAAGGSDRNAGDRVPAAGAGDAGPRAGVEPGDVRPVDAPRFNPQTQNDLAPKTGKLEANLEALRTLRAIEADGDRPATPDEQQKLARWAGWGSLAAVFGENPKSKARYAKQRAELERLLPDEKEWEKARQNALNAHYTDLSMVDPVWQALDDLGFKGGRVLEPGSGSGNFIGRAPENARMVGVEVERTTARIAQKLYPDAEIRQEGFEETRMKDGSFDAVVGNVPFGKYDLRDPVHNKAGHSIHNHFIIKSLHLAKPGGIVAVHTSRYTLDAKSSKARKEMAELGDLVGAVRVPEGSHKDAAGTDVVTDLLIFRRRKPGEVKGDTSWIDSKPMELADGSTQDVNSYFHQHPENVLGEMKSTGGMYGADELTVTGDQANVGQHMTEALQRITADAKAKGLTDGVERTGDDAIDSPALPSVGPVNRALEGRIGEGDKVHERIITHGADGKPLKKPRHESTTFTQVVGGVEEPYYVPKTQQAELRKLISLNDTFTSLVDAEAQSEKDTPELAAMRQRLNDEYDSYVKAHGPITRFDYAKTKDEPKPKDEVDENEEPEEETEPRRVYPQMGGISTNPYMQSVFALEAKYDPKTKTATKSDIFTKRTVSKRELPTTADNGADALNIALERDGHLNLATVADLLGTDEAGARKAIRGLVFTDPTTGGLVQKAEYLSGDVRQKLREARKALADGNADMEHNIAELEAVKPTEKGPGEIHVALGAPWIDAADVEQFVNDLVPGRPARVTNPMGATWTVRGGSRSGTLPQATWGTKRKPFHKLVEQMLSGSEIKVTDDVEMPDGKIKKVLNVEATEAAQAKAEEIADRFADWVWEDSERAARLQERFNDLFRAQVARSYDGSAKRAYPGMSKKVSLYAHQNDAVTRIVNEPSALLAHVVGAGKTFTMQAGSMELKRTGIAKKPAHVIPNHMLEQYVREFKQLYPQARILAADSKSLTGNKRRQFLARAASGDWDAVVFTQEAFKKVPLSEENTKAYLENELKDLRSYLQRAMEEEGKSGDGVKQIEKQVKNAETRIQKLMDNRQDDGGLTLEQTGIDYLFVDELHHYKNLRTVSKDSTLAKPGSKKATDLDMKLGYLRHNSATGRVFTGATGTPIANSISEAYIMQRYLRPDLLDGQGLRHFDTWLAMYGEKVTSVEMSVDGNSFKPKTRVAKFRNAGELIRSWSIPTDVKRADHLDLERPDLAPNPENEGQRTARIVAVPRTSRQEAYIEYLGERAEAVKSGAVTPDEDNMLKISSDGRKAALDMRLIDDPDFEDWYEERHGGGDAEDSRKIETVAGQVGAIYHANKDRTYKVERPKKGQDPNEVPDHPTKGALQIVFCDLGTPKDKESGKFSAYDEMRAQLVKQGVPANKVRFIHEASTAQEKAELFEKCRNGDVAVLIGSTEKMGVGTNVQDRAVALHHVDVPWRPADLEQRDGRVIRQGNQNDEVHVQRYVTEGTFDAYMWGTVERKAGFIEQVYRGDLDADEIEDIGDAQADAALVKSIASGNPLLVDQAFLGNELRKLQRREKNHQRGLGSAKRTIADERGKIKNDERDIAALELAKTRRVSTAGDDFKANIQSPGFGHSGQEFTSRSEAGDHLKESLEWAFSRNPGYFRSGGTLGGHSFTIENITSQAWGSRLEVGFDFPGGKFEVTKADLQSPNASTSLMSKLEGRLNRIDDEIAKRRGFIKKSEAEIAASEAEASRPFKQADELDLVKRRQAAVDKLLEMHENNDEESVATKKALTAQYVDDTAKYEDVVGAKKAKAAAAAESKPSESGEPKQRAAGSSGKRDDVVKVDPEQVQSDFEGMGAPEKAPKPVRESSDAPGEAETADVAPEAEQVSEPTVDETPTEDVPTADEPAAPVVAEPAVEETAADEAAPEPTAAPEGETVAKPSTSGTRSSGTSGPSGKKAPAFKPSIIDQGPTWRQLVDPEAHDRVLFDVKQDEHGVWEVYQAGMQVPQVSFGTWGEARRWSLKHAHLQRDGKELPDGEGNFVDDVAHDTTPSAPERPKYEDMRPSDFNADETPSLIDEGTVRAAQPTDRPDDEFGTPDMFDEGQGVPDEITDDSDDEESSWDDGEGADDTPVVTEGLHVAEDSSHSPAAVDRVWDGNIIRARDARTGEIVTGKVSHQTRRDSDGKNADRTGKPVENTEYHLSGAGTVVVPAGHKVEAYHRPMSGMHNTRHSLNFKDDKALQEKLADLEANHARMEHMDAPLADLNQEASNIAAVKAEMQRRAAAAGPAVKDMEQDEDGYLQWPNSTVGSRHGMHGAAEDADLSPNARYDITLESHDGTKTTVLRDVQPVHTGEGYKRKTTWVDKDGNKIDLDRNPDGYAVQYDVVAGSTTFDGPLTHPDDVPLGSRVVGFGPNRGVDTEDFEGRLIRGDDGEYKVFDAHGVEHPIDRDYVVPVIKTGPGGHVDAAELPTKGRKRKAATSKTKAEEKPAEPKQESAPEAPAEEPKAEEPTPEPERVDAPVTATGGDGNDGGSVEPPATPSAADEPQPEPAKDVAPSPEPVDPKAGPRPPKDAESVADPARLNVGDVVYGKIHRADGSRDGEYGEISVESVTSDAQHITAVGRDADGHRVIVRASRAWGIWRTGENPNGERAFDRPLADDGNQPGPVKPGDLRVGDVVRLTGKNAGSWRVTGAPTKSGFMHEVQVERHAPGKANDGETRWVKIASNRDVMRLSRDEQHVPEGNTDAPESNDKVDTPAAPDVTPGRGDGGSDEPPSAPAAADVPEPDETPALSFTARGDGGEDVHQGDTRLGQVYSTPTGRGSAVDWHWESADEEHGSDHPFLTKEQAAAALELHHREQAAGPQPLRDPETYEERLDSLDDLTRKGDDYNEDVAAAVAESRARKAAGDDAGAEVFLREAEQAAERAGYVRDGNHSGVGEHDKPHRNRWKLYHKPTVFSPLGTFGPNPTRNHIKHVPGGGGGLPDGGGMPSASGPRLPNVPGDVAGEPGAVTDAAETVASQGDAIVGDVSESGTVPSVAKTAETLPGRTVGDGVSVGGASGPDVTPTGDAPAGQRALLNPETGGFGLTGSETQFAKPLSRHLADMAKAATDEHQAAALRFAAGILTSRANHSYGGAEGQGKQLAEMPQDTLDKAGRSREQIDGDVAAIGRLADEMRGHNYSAKTPNAKGREGRNLADWLAAYADSYRTHREAQKVEERHTADTPTEKAAQDVIVKAEEAGDPAPSHEDITEATGVNDDVVPGETEVSPEAVADAAAALEATPQPGVWEQTIQVSDDGHAITGTAFGDPQEVRDAVKSNGYKWDKSSKRWIHPGSDEAKAQAGQNVREALRKLDAAEAARAMAEDDKGRVEGEEHAPTPQQRAVIDAVKSGMDVVVRALAGTGKTSTLLAVARRHASRPITYVAFNRSIRAEAQQKFPKNVKVLTSDALAFHALPTQEHKDRLFKGEQRPKEVAALLGINSPVARQDGPDLTPPEVAVAALRTLRAWNISADDEISAKHVPESIRGDRNAERALVGYAQSAWADAENPNGKLFFSPEHAMKMYARTNPTIPGDLIFFDEAQDTNEVLAGILGKQKAQKVVVGDSNQSIYGFRGASDVLDKWQAGADLGLTQSWRFGPEVAAAGNRFLQLLGTHWRVTGNPGKDSTIGEIANPDAILTRTNAGAVAEIAAELKKGRRVATAGDAKELKAFARAAGDLKEGRGTANPELRHFKSWDEVDEFAQETDDGNLKAMIRLIESEGPQGLLDLLDQLAPEYGGDRAPDVVVSTVHKAKGREWPNVRIGSDFKGPEVDAETGKVKAMPDPEELRLAYVAVTRAENRLDPGSLAWAWDHTSHDDGTSPAKQTPEAPEAPGSAVDAPQAAPEAPEVPAATDAAAEPAGDVLHVTPEDIAADLAKEGVQAPPSLFNRPLGESSGGTGRSVFSGGKGGTTMSESDGSILNPANAAATIGSGGRRSEDTPAPEADVVDEGPRVGFDPAEQPAAPKAPAPAPEKAPEPINGAPAEWVPVTDLIAGDAARLDVRNTRGARSTTSGYVMAPPTLVGVTDRTGTRMMWVIPMAEHEDGSGWRSSGYVEQDALAARAVDAGAGVSAAQGQVIHGEGGDVPVDRFGYGLFPGATVSDPDMNSGKVAGIEGRGVMVQWEHGKTTAALPSHLTVTDNGNARPDGWTRDGHKLSAGDVVKSEKEVRYDDHNDGTVVAVEDDMVQIRRSRDGKIVSQRAAGLQWLGQTDPESPAEKAEIAEPVTVQGGDAKDVKTGDSVLLHDGDGSVFPAEVTDVSQGDDGTEITYRDSRTGEPGEAVAGDAPVPVVRNEAGEPARLDPQQDADGADTPEGVQVDDDVVLGPVEGPVTEPSLLPAVRRDTGDLGLQYDPQVDSAAQEAVMRVMQGEPLSTEQAQALASELRRIAGDDDTAKARGMRRLADSLDGAAAPTGKGTAAHVTPASVTPGDTVAIPNDDGTVTVGTVVDTNPVMGGRVGQVEVDTDGDRQHVVVPGGSDVFVLPDTPADEPVDGGFELEQQNGSGALPEWHQFSVRHSAEMGRQVTEAAAKAAEHSGSLAQMRDMIAAELTSQAFSASRRNPSRNLARRLTAAGIDGAARTAAMEQATKVREGLEQDLRESLTQFINDFHTDGREPWEQARARAAAAIRDSQKWLAGEAERRNRDYVATDKAPAADVESVLDEVPANTRRVLDDVDEAHQTQVPGDIVDEATAQGLLPGMPVTPEKARAVEAGVARRVRARNGAALSRAAATLPGTDEEKRPLMERIAAFLTKLADAAKAVARAVLKGWERTSSTREAVKDAARRMRRDSGRALPAAGRFGKHKVRGHRFDGLRLADLRSGKQLESTVAERLVKDVAVDGGPGHAASRHLAAVKQYGTGLDDKVRQSMHEVIGDQSEALHSQYAEAMAAAARDAVAATRQVGPQNGATLNVEGDSAAVAALRHAEASLPTAWLQAIAGKRLTARTADSGFYDPHSGVIGVSGDGNAMHELMHVIEEALPELADAAAAYHFTRTSRGQVGARQRTGANGLVDYATEFPGSGYTPGTVGRVGDYADAAAGREFPGGRSDVLAHGVEQLFTGGAVDDDLRRFTLGALATLGRRAA